MKLVNEKEFSSVAKLNKFGGEAIAKVLMQLLKLNKINRLYSQNYQKQAPEFIQTAINELGLKYEVNPEELSRIPSKGAFITVSNHPLGGIDGLLLIKIMLEKRPDYKVMANFLLERMAPMKDKFFSVNPFETHKEASSSLKGIKASLEHLKNGAGMGIFPAGEVSTYQPDFHKITDREWQFAAIKFIKKAQVPVIPVYFFGNNSLIFHLLGQIHPLLRTARLPYEVFNKKKKNIKIRIGQPITVEEQNEFENISQYGRYLRAKTYSLGSAIEVKKFIKPNFRWRIKKVKDIAPPAKMESVLKEIEQIKKDNLLFQFKHFSIISAMPDEIPNLMHEIGRLREITFREVGEGTNKSIDLDEFDLYYHQLIIWDEDQKQIVGAYRLGKGKDILAQYGVKGFYSRTLFKMSAEMKPVLEQTIELGRSFIVKAYQRKPFSLFLLWKGILYFLFKNAEYRYLMGPVSISNNFSKFSKSLIVAFLEKNYFNHEIAEYISPKKQFKFHKKTTRDKDVLIQQTKDFKRLDKYLKDIENNLTTPVLIKKYIQLNAKIIGFNIDPKFNDCLDGLMLLDLFDVPVNVIESLSKEVNDESILKRFKLSELN